MTLNCPRNNAAPVYFAAVLAMLLSSEGWARVLNPLEVATVAPGQPPETWTVPIGALLTVPIGATTLRINATNSTLTIDGGNVTSGAPLGISLVGSQATINNATISSTGDFGLGVERNGALVGGPSTATISNSNISGVGSGVIATFGSTVTVSNGSIITGSGNGSPGFTGGSGLTMIGATGTVQSGSTLTGSAQGVALGSDILGAAAGANVSLSVDASTLTGTSGSAILVGSFEPTLPTKATITIANGSTLNGGNGLALKVDNNSTAQMTVDNSVLNGGILVTPGSTGSVTLDNSARVAGNVTNVTDFTLNNGSSLSGNLTDTTNLNANSNSSISGNVANVQNFNLTGNSSVAGNLSNITNLSLDNSTWTTNDGNGVTNLRMNAGTVKLGSTAGTFETLTVATLSGNGRFVMDTDLAAHQSDLVNVTGNATGSYDLHITNSGADPATGDQAQQVVHTGAGSDAAFAVLGGKVDLGTLVYNLEQRGTDWFLVQELNDNGQPIISPGAESVVAVASAEPTVWYGELSTLRSRMGELRYGQTEGGLWARAYGNKYNTSAAGGVGYSQNQQGISFGADTALPTSSGKWLVGLLGGYSKSDLDIAEGATGTVHSAYLGVYSTWLSDEGYYVDAIVKANRFKNKTSASLSDGTQADGDHNNHGIGASIEAGKHIKLADDWFVEPFTQLSALWVNGDSYSLNDGMDASTNKADSFLGKVGTVVGRNFALDKGGFVQPYVKVALAHEFANNNKVQVNTTTFRNDLSGSRGELGAGLAAQLTTVLQVHGDIDYSNGDHIEQPWGVNVGLRYSW